MLKTIILLLRALPEIIRLIETLQRRADDKAESKKIKEDVAKIDKAFKEKDAQALNDVFNNRG